MRRDEERILRKKKSSLHESTISCCMYIHVRLREDCVVNLFLFEISVITLRKTMYMKLGVSLIFEDE
jgi:hypothetical protein